MKIRFSRPFPIPLLLCLVVCFTSEARAQETPPRPEEPLPEFRLRSGKVIKAFLSMDASSGYVELGDEQGHKRRIERSSISLICFSDCKGASNQSMDDLIVMKDGQRKFGETGWVNRISYNFFMKRWEGSAVTLHDRVKFTQEEIPLKEIAYIKFSDHVFYTLQQALRARASAYRLVLKQYKPGLRHLPASLGRLTNLKELEIACLEDLKDLPAEIGNLRKLEKLIIDNGNGCAMGITIPASIGHLQNLKVLDLRGALGKAIPNAVAKLQNLEELDLSQNGLRAIPSPVASLHKLKTLRLDYSDITEIPGFIARLKSLKDLSVMNNEVVKINQALVNKQGLTIYLGNNSLKLKDQESLRKRFPNLILDFEDDIEDSTVNERPPDPKAKN